MLTSRRFCLAVIPVVSYTVFAAFTPSVTAQSVTAICEPKITASREVATPAERKAAGEIALPPLTDTADGFAWPDTQLGVIKADGGYVFFGSDGGYHARQYATLPGVVIVPEPLILLHVPVPTVGAFPANVAVVVSHKFWFGPASAVVGVASIVIVILSLWKVPQGPEAFPVRVNVTVPAAMSPGPGV